MKPTYSIRRLKRWLLVGSMLPAYFLVGCQTSTHCNNGGGGFGSGGAHDPCATITPGALNAPNGSFVRKFQLDHTNKAAMDDFVVYPQERYMGGEKLGPYGHYHIARIAQ